jgi:hypothetical protein
MQDDYSEQLLDIYNILSKYTKIKMDINSVEKWNKNGIEGMLFGLKDSKGYYMLKFGYLYDAKSKIYFPFKDCRNYVEKLSVDDSNKVHNFIELYKSSS